MRTPPKFWFVQNAKWLSVILGPLSWIWTAETRRRLRKLGYRAEVPVICVGNVTIGGAGKTPTTIAIVEHLRAAGHQPVVLLRGYGGTNKTARQVKKTDAASLVGDEALLHVAYAPTVVSPDRALGAQLAQSLGDIIVMDDGLQNSQLVKDVSILVVDTGVGIGNGRVIPAGPLREPIGDILARIDCVLNIGDGEGVNVDTLPSFVAKIVPSVDHGLAGRKFIAFAGIARPDKFYQLLKSEGAHLIETHDFGDHERIDDKEFDALVKRASALGGALVTTEKDFIKLSAEQRAQVISIAVKLNAEDGFFALIDRALKNKLG